MLLLGYARVRADAVWVGVPGERQMGWQKLKTGWNESRRNQPVTEPLA